MSGVRDVVLIAGIALLPLCSIQHFIWPLSWCLLADICNHTWIPECGYDELLDAYRLFIDECDMFEYNCDHETDYEPVNYSDCFKQQMCPVARIPCPSRPTCPDHRYHRMGDKYVYLTPERRNARKHMRRNGMRMENLRKSLPPKMLKGKRRYTPKGRRKIMTPKMTTLLTPPIRKFRKVFVKRRTLASNKHTRTKERFPSRTTIFVPTRTMKQLPTRTIKQARTRKKKQVKRVRNAVATTRKLAPSDKYEQTIVGTTPVRAIMSTASPNTFRTIILRRETVKVFGKKMIRIIKGRLTSFQPTKLKIKSINSYIRKNKHFNISYL